jgi:hypothetical protein
MSYTGFRIEARSVNIGGPDTKMTCGRSKYLGTPFTAAPTKKTHLVALGWDRQCFVYRIEASQKGTMSIHPFRFILNYFTHWIAIALYSILMIYINEIW